MRIDKYVLESFREDFKEAMKDLEKKYGVIVHLGTIRYGYDNFDAKLEVKVGTSQEDVEKKEFEKYCEMYGLVKEDYNQIFTQKGTQYKIIGIDPAKRKYPIIIEEVLTGKRVRCTIDFIRSA